MLSVDQAERQILDLVDPLHDPEDTEVIDLQTAIGRVLATAATSSLDFPHWDNSAMDGYAVRFADVGTCEAEQPVFLEIIEEIPAGYQPQATIQPGQCARIFTGSLMPAGADTIVIQEYTQRQGNQVLILKSPQPGAFVRRQGSFYESGHPLLPAGIALTAPDLAVLAAAQCAQVRVYRRPRVAILSTGSELVEIDRPLQPGQIVDSNQLALTALIKQMGADALPLGIIPDQPEPLISEIAHARTIADMILSSGGVSVGDYDHVEDSLNSLGAALHIRAVAMRPGKPLTVATFKPDSTSSSPRSILYFGLPGNPVSAFVTFWRFVQPALRKLSGRSEGWLPTVVQAKTRQALRSDGQRETYLWGRLHLVNGEYEFTLAGGSHSSGNLINLAQTNGLAVLPVGETTVNAGAQVKVLLVTSG
jgi:molybdopterin molybdotransferase